MLPGGTSRSSVAHLASRSDASPVIGVDVIRKLRGSTDSGSERRKGKKNFDLSGAGIDGCFDQPLMHRETDALGQELHRHSNPSPAESSPVFRCLDSLRPNCTSSDVASSVSIPDFGKSDELR